MPGLFRFFSLPYLRRRPLKAVLTLIAMASGIAVFTSIDLANRGVIRGLQDTLQKSSGGSDLSIEGNPSLRDEDFARVLALPGLEAASPVVEGRASCAAGFTFTLLGIEPLSGLAFLRSAEAKPRGDPRLLSEPRIVVPPTLAQRCNFKDGETTLLSIDSRSARVVIAFEKSGDAAETPLAFTDIALAQELLGKVGRLDRIEVKLSEGDVEAWRRQQEKRFDERWIIHPLQERKNITEEILKAFQLNLTALGLVSIFVAGFIVYNAASFSVLYRRSDLGNLRAFGATRAQVGLLLGAEFLFLGLVASFLGFLLGWAFARLVFSQVLQTVRDLYLSQAVGRIGFDASSLAKSFAIGVAASLLGAALPLWEALHVAPVEAARRLSYEKRFRRHPVFILGASFLFFLAAGLSAYLGSPHAPAWGFASALCLLLAFLFLTPFCLRFVALSFKGFSRVLRCGFAQAACAQILENPYRYSVVTAALSLAVALWIGIGSMIHSFRLTVIDWIGTSIRGDLYLTLQDNERGRFESFLPPPFIEAVRALPGIAFVDSLRQVQVRSQGESIPLSAIEWRALMKRRNFSLLSGSSSAFQESENTGAPTPVTATESLARRKDLRVGDSLNLETAWGHWPVVITAVVRNYSSERGLLYMDRGDFVAKSGDTRLNHLALYLEDPTAAANLAKRIESLPERPPGFKVLLNAELKERILRIFEQTFRLTEALKYAALIVAFLGILSTLVLLLEEKRREIGLLQALGMTPLQLSGFALTQGLVLALVGEILGLGAGLALCQVLIQVIHRNYFGWTIFFAWNPALLAVSLVLTLATGALASLAAFSWLKKIRPAEALRMEE